MKKELEKVYDPKQVEDKTYRFWMDKGYFHAEPNPQWDHPAIGSGSGLRWTRDVQRP